MARVLTVLQSFPTPRPTTNPYLVMLADALAGNPRMSVLNFRWRTALTGHYDVFHVHWPEIMITGGAWHKRTVRQLLFVVLLARLRLTRTPIVRTQHNVARPEGLNWIQDTLLSGFEAQTTAVIRLNGLTPAQTPGVTITHGHYRDWFADYPQLQLVPGRFAFVGLIRRYKGVEALIAAFHLAEDPELSLTVSGNPSHPELATTLHAMAGSDPRVALDLRFLPDADFVQAVTESELMVFPYTFMHNSGGVLAALSLDRRVLVPDNDVNRELSAEVGPGWVSLFKDPLGPEDLVQALAAGRAEERGAHPDLSQRSWHHVADEHFGAYVRAVEELHGGRRR